jgi:hypothetical protein
MGSRILFVAGPDDIKALADFIRGLGLHLVPPQSNQRYTDDSGFLTGCFISPIPADQLRTWGSPSIRYSDVLDPILSFTRSVYDPPYLTPGNIYWNDDVPALASETKSTFQKIARWIRKNWPKPEGDDWHFGPEATHLVFEKGIEATSMVPGVTFNGMSVVPG